MVLITDFHHWGYKMSNPAVGIVVHGCRGNGDSDTRIVFMSMNWWLLFNSRDFARCLGLLDR